MAPSFSWDIPEDVLGMRDLAFAWQMGAPEGVTVSARTTVLDYESLVLVSRIESWSGKKGVAVGLKPDDWPIGKAIPALSHPAIENLTLDKVALVVTDQEVRLHSSELSPAAREFYQEVYRSDEYELVLTPGLNLIAAFPIEKMRPDDPLKQIFERLGFQSGVVLLQGTLGASLAAITTGAISLDLIKDIYLRASLPKMRPPQSPAWFKSGQLALEITGVPSVGLVGEITVELDEEVLVFSVAAKIAKDGFGAAVALVGALRSLEPWVHPFGQEWLIFSRTILKLSVDMKANIGLGFAAKMVIGEKDLDIAVAVKVNASGAVTNFLFDGASTAGISMADLAALQAGMQKGRALLPGKPPPPAIPLDRLPPMEIRDIHLKFALKDDADLEVDRGLALKGELWIEMREGAPMNNFAGVDFSVDDSGIVAKAHLGAYAIGPVSWDDALLDLELTMARQNLTISGAADIGIARQEIEVSITRKGAFFQTETTVLDRFTARLDADAPFTIEEPVWSIRGEMDNDFNGALADLALARLRAWADDHERAMATARAASEAATLRAERASERLAELEASVKQGQAEAKRAMESAARARDAAAKAKDRAEAAVRAARQAFESTPARNVKQKAERKAAVVKAEADLAARRAALAAKQAEYAAKQAAYDALSSDAVEAARRDAREARDAADAARQRLEETEAMIAGIRSGDGTPIVIDRAGFQGRLDTHRGATVELQVDLRFLDRPRSVAVEWGFERLEGAAHRVVEAVLDR